MHIKLWTSANTDRAINDDRYSDNRGWSNGDHNSKYYDFKLGCLRISTIKTGGARLRREILSCAKTN